MTSQTQKLIYLHGLDSSSQGVKARLLRGLFPEIVTPDFGGALEQRMTKLESIVGDTQGWAMVGSSFGGLMAALFACRNPEQVSKLILLAPALIWPDFAAAPPAPVSMPVVVYHGRRDELIPLAAVQGLAERVFTNLDFHTVDDDHGLYQTVHAIDWRAIVQA
jgi:pimeloyl-ACP methyl ester carboxylesterase